MLRFSAMPYAMPAYQVTSTDPTKKLIFCLLASFLLLAPMSVSGYATEPGWEWLKWARVALLGILGLACFRWFRFPPLSTLSGKLLLFGAFYTAGAIWSTSPTWGLLFKGMYFATLIVGFCLASVLQSEGDFRLFSRVMTSAGIVSVIGVALWTLDAYQSGIPLFWNGRIQALRLNPNFLALSAAVFVLLSGFHLVLKDSRNWIIAASSVIVSMVVLILLSGSRAAFLVVIAGLVSLLPVLGKSFRQFLLLLVISSVIFVFLGQYTFNEEDVVTTSDRESQVELRIAEELTKDTRLNMWQSILNKSLKEPVIGIGWMQVNNRWATTQSAYLQVLLETGFVGLLLYGWFAVASISTIISLFRNKIAFRGFNRSRLFVFCATASAMLFHGVFESAVVTGTSPISVILAICCGQLDQVSSLLQSRRYSPLSK